LAEGAANTSYRLADEGGAEFVVTVLDNTANLDPETLVQLLTYVDQRGVLTGSPVMSIDGNFVEHVDGHVVVVKGFVVGRSFAVLPVEHLAAAGAALARIHAVDPPDWLPRGTRRLGDSSATLARVDDREFVDWVAENLATSEPMLALAGTTRLIHGDFFADNLVVTRNNDVAAIDWETASVDLPLIDLGWAIVGLACTSGSLSVRRLQILLDGYTSVRQLDACETTFLQSAAIYAATVIAYHRYVRHHLRFPNPAKFTLYREMVDIADSIRAGMPSKRRIR